MNVFYRRHAKTRMKKKPVAGAGPSCPALINQLVTDEGDVFAIGRPGGDVDGALAAEQGGEVLDGAIAATKEHEAQLHGLIFGMAADGFIVGKEHEPFAIGRR